MQCEPPFWVYYYTFHVYSVTGIIVICMDALLLSPYIVNCGGQNATSAAFLDMFSSRGSSFSSRGRTPATPRQIEPWPPTVFTALCTLVQMRGLGIACRLSVCPSVTLVDCDHIGWKSPKLIARTISPTPSFFGAKRRSTYSQGNMGKFWGN